MPYVMGVHAMHMKAVLALPVEELIVVDLDKDKVSAAASTLSSFRILLIISFVAALHRQKWPILSVPDA